MPQLPDPTSLPLFTTATQTVPALRTPSTGTLAATRRPHQQTGAGQAPTSPASSQPQGLDWTLVAAFRAQASNQLTKELGQDRNRLDRHAQQELGRAIINDLLAAATAEHLSEGRPAWSLPQQDALAEAIFAALFGLGRLQPLVDDERVENIMITGCDRVILELEDGTLKPGRPVADSDQELIDFLVFLASRSEVNARVFSEAQPRLHLRLDGGARLAAAAWVTPRPSVVIRRHRLRQVTLADLVGRGTLSDTAASFLSAAVKAGKSIVVSGIQSAGKTTLVRALCRELPKWEPIGTFETEYELHLHELTDQHAIVHAWEARPGAGERGPDGRQAGEFTLSEALYDSFRFNLGRQIVGEVRGHEIRAMLKAMESSRGSISTTHAPNADAAIGKLVTCMMDAGLQVTPDYAIRAIAAAINIVVHVHLETTPLPDGTARRSRWVSEILAIEPSDEPKGYQSTTVFRSAPAGPGIADTIPDQLAATLAAFGFDYGAFLTEAQHHRRAS